jgi:hypothetical protein
MANDPLLQRALSRIAKIAHLTRRPPVKSSRYAASTCARQFFEGF